MSPDSDRLRIALGQAVRSAVSELLSAHPCEVFYAFALFTDDDVTSIQLAANSEAGLEEAVARYRLKDPRSIAGIRFSTGEWKYEGFGGGHFRPANEILSRRQPTTGDRKHLAAFRRGVMALMVEGLSDLDVDDNVGRGPERDAITLLCSVTDATKAGEQYQDRSVRKLNPPAVVAAYEATMKAARAPKWSGGPPCPSCGKPLRTPLAKQCFLCGAIWRDDPAPAE